MSEETGATARYEQGLATRRAVLGEDYVAGRLEKTTAFEAPFQELITEAAWGNVWSRETWSKRQRSIVTIALLAALGHYEEMAMHVRATRRTGASAEDLQEVMMHVAIYAGVPRANHAIGIIRDILDQDREAQG